MWRAALLALVLSAAAWVSVADSATIMAMPGDKPGMGIIFLEGEITPGDREDFLTKVASFSSGMVVLDSPGGSAYAGVEIGKAIRMRGLSTWVPSGSTCASACAFAWLGGTKRVVGKTAQVGFHAVYQMKNGAAVETGSGNASVGAYLAQLGLSDTAIRYLTDAAPTSMNWLTAADAQALGIDVAVYDPPETQAQPSATVAAPLDPIEMRSRQFIFALNGLVSGSSETFARLLDGLYADQVSYYGKQISRADVIAQIKTFIARWPVRSYLPEPSSINVQCDQNTLYCRVQGLVNFDSKSPSRNQRSHGVATFDYLLAFRPGEKWPLIAMENGKFVNRRVEPLVQATNERSPFDFNARQ
jgi:ATP-dependent protease ClpP protease subunit